MKSINGIQAFLDLVMSRGALVDGLFSWVVKKKPDKSYFVLYTVA